MSKAADIDFLRRSVQRRVEQAIEAAGRAEAEVMADAAGKGALQSGRTILVMNERLLASYNDAVEGMVRFLHAAAGNTDEAAAILNEGSETLAKQIADNVTLRYTHTPLPGFSISSKIIGELRQRLKLVRDAVVDDFRHGMLRDSTLSKDQGAIAAHELATSTPRSRDVFIVQGATTPRKTVVARHYSSMDDRGACKAELLGELKAAGYEVDWAKALAGASADFDYGRKDRADELDRPARQQITHSSENTNALAPTIGYGDEFERVEDSGSYMIRTFSVCVMNSDVRDFLSNCKLSVKIDNTIHLLRKSFTLNPT
jgi:hypothetical protein